MTSREFVSFILFCNNMADSDSLESYTSAVEFDGRLRSAGKDIINRMTTDKTTPNKPKYSTSSASAPQIGASYLVRRHDDTCRKSDRINLKA